MEEEYIIVDKPRTSENPTSNTILKHIHGVLSDLVWTYNIKDTYIDKGDLWLVILVAVEFTVRSAKMVEMVILRGN